MDNNQAPKKISFGFSKQIKTSVSAKPQEKVQLIDCLEGKSIKLKEGEEDLEKKPLIIPLKEKDRTSTAAALTKLAKVVDTQIKANDETAILENESLDAKAARELMEEAKNTSNLKTQSNEFVVPLNEPDVNIGVASTLDDYEKIPVNDFGLAMLRGMGWKEGQGIGKQNKNVEIAPPKMRPKGLGLGADKVAMVPSQTDKGSKADSEEKLQIVNGACVKITAGKHKDAYGQILGFDEAGMRVIIKLAINGTNININEMMLQAVTKDEYQKKSKVLNAAKYEEFVSKNLNNMALNNSKPPNHDNREAKASKDPFDDEPRNRRRDSSESPDRHRKHKSESRRQHRRYSSESSDSGNNSDRKLYYSRSRDSDKKRKGKKKRRDRSRSRDRRRR